MAKRPKKLSEVDTTSEVENKSEIVKKTNSTVDLTKLKEAVEALADADPSNMDLIEIIGVFVDDVADLYKAKDSVNFLIQKRDARNTLKILKRRFMNLTYKTL